MNFKKKYAQVLYDFAASYSDELSVKASDTLEILYQKDENWVYAKLLSESNRLGLVPINYLHLLDSLPNVHLRDGQQLINKELDQKYSSRRLSEESNYYEIIDNSDLYENVQINSASNSFVNKNPNLNSQSSSSFNELPNNTCRQAKVMRSFRSPKYNNEFNYLNLQTDTYILVRGQIDENWLNVETFNGESGLFPAKYIQYLESDDSTTLNETLPILNRTQRRYTFGSEDMAAQNYYETTSNEKENVQFFAKYCKVDYDFQPVSEQELGCLRGEYLQIDEIIGEWYKCTNKYGKIGNVPYNYVTILDSALGQDLFQNQNKATTVQLPQTPNVYMNTLDVPSTINPLSKSDSAVNMKKNNGLHFGSSEFLPKRDSVSPISTQVSFKNTSNGNFPSVSNTTSNLSPLLTQNLNKASEQQLNKFFQSNNDRTSRTNTPLLPNTQPKNVIKPPIPPKPKFFPKNFDNKISVTNPFYENVYQQLPQDDSAKKIEDKVQQRLTQRKLTIVELIETERDYCNQIEAFYLVFNDDSIKCPEEFNRTVMFSKLKAVIQVSRAFLSLVDTEMQLNNNQVDKINIAECLIKPIEQFKEAYSKYTRDYNEIIELTKKYAKIDALNDYMNFCLGKLKVNSKLTSMESLLIFPVQRIFKYSLFINRIIENTDTNDSSIFKLKEAARLYADMLDYINEYKRRQELVAKYLRTDQTDPTELMKKLTMKTIMKKSNRITLQLSNAFGLRNTLVHDERFERLDAQFKWTERLGKSFFNDANSFLFNLKDVLDYEKTIFTDVLHIFSDDILKNYAHFEQSAIANRSTKLHNYMTKLHETILSPMNQLFHFMTRPNKLIQKREDKQMDYESALSDYDLNSHSKEIEGRLTKARKDYEALNDQLLDELPIFVQNAQKIIANSILSFVYLTNQFIQSLNSSLKNDIKSTSLELQPFNQATLIIKLYTMNKLFKRDSLTASNEPMRPANSSFLSKPTYKLQSEEQREKVLRTFPVDKIYVVTQKYIPNERLCQLGQNIYDLVGVRRTCDPSQNKEIWFVDNGETEGFVPRSALTPYGELVNNKNLIDLNQDLSESQAQLKSPAFLLRKEEVLIDFSDENPAKCEEPKEEFCVALFQFKASHQNMINLIPEQIYRVVQKHDEKGNKDWWLLEYEGFFKGYAPMAYVKLLD